MKKRPVDILFTEKEIKKFATQTKEDRLQHELTELTEHLIKKWGRDVSVHHYVKNIAEIYDIDYDVVWGEAGGEDC